jgi:flagellar L-ring protein precursor FlgH
MILGRACFVLVAVSMVLNACGPAHIRPFTPRNRNYEQGDYATLQKDSHPAKGSIYTDAQAGYLEDTRALRVGDVVQININEEANAQGGAETDLTRSSARDDQLNSLLGLVPAIKKAYPNIDPTTLINFAAKTDFTGKGQTQRQGQLSGNIGVRVKKELPNGDLYVEGTKVVMINNEEYHLYISGVIRTADIENDNSVSSALVADARVEFTGRGDVADQVDRGWLSKILDVIKPF